MDRFLEDPGHRLDLWLEPGQIQILNNRVIVHGRTRIRTAKSPSDGGISSGSGFAASGGDVRCTSVLGGISVVVQGLGRAGA